jgi:hypothetical protein
LRKNGRWMHQEDGAGKSEKWMDRQGAETSAPCPWECSHGFPLKPWSKDN